MIISRRRFNNEIYMAVEKKEREMWERRNRDDEMDALRRRISELEQRVYTLEYKVNPKESHVCANDICDRVNVARGSIC